MNLLIELSLQAQKDLEDQKSNILNTLIDNKKIAVILIVALLFLEGVVSLLANERDALGGGTVESYELIELPTEAGLIIISRR